MKKNNLGYIFVFIVPSTIPAYLQSYCNYNALGKYWSNKSKEKQQGREKKEKGGGEIRRKRGEGRSGKDREKAPATVLS